MVSAGTAYSAGSFTTFAALIQYILLSSLPFDNILLNFLLHFFTYLVSVCACVSTHIEVRGQPAGVSSHLPPSGSQELNSVRQGWQLMPLFAESSGQSSNGAFNPSTELLTFQKRLISVLISLLNF